MDYLTIFREKNIAANDRYPHNDIGIARLFFDLHGDIIRYVLEPKSWYVFNGRRWEKDSGAFKVMELCKLFAESYAKYSELMDDGSEESKVFMKFANSFTGRKRREGLLSDARSIQPMNLAQFDRNKMLFNCQNGTYNLVELSFRPHNANDFITKMSRVKYTPNAVCKRWEQFISEIMSRSDDGVFRKGNKVRECGAFSKYGEYQKSGATCKSGASHNAGVYREDKETALFLQKALGYCLSGDTSLECFFILYGSTTRNGKSTLMETVSYILDDYARTIQPQTLSRRPSDGSAASPDIARLKGARLVSMPEPEKGLELNTALIKQLTGGDTYTGRFLHENPVEFKPEFKIFINTNHLPRTFDDTVFSSGRVKLIPFERHFPPNEQDNNLKRIFCKHHNMNGIFNWLLEGYKLLREDIRQSGGLSVPDKVMTAICEYRQETDVIGTFIIECTTTHEGSRLSTSDLYTVYSSWAKGSGYKPLNLKSFVAELRRRYEVRRGNVGNVVVGLALVSDSSSDIELDLDCGRSPHIEQLSNSEPHDVKPINDSEPHDVKLLPDSEPHDNKSHNLNK